MTIPIDHPNPAAYRLATEQNLAMALLERKNSLVRAGLDESEASIEAAKEMPDLAPNLDDPTPTQLTEAASQLAAEATDSGDE